MTKIYSQSNFGLSKTKYKKEVGQARLFDAEPTSSYSKYYGKSVSFNDHKNSLAVELK